MSTISTLSCEEVLSEVLDEISPALSDAYLYRSPDSASNKKRVLETPPLTTPANSSKKSAIKIVAKTRFRLHPFFINNPQECAAKPTLMCAKCTRCSKPPTIYICTCATLAVCTDCAPIDFVHRKLFGVGCAHCGEDAPRYAAMVQTRESVICEPNEAMLQEAHQQLLFAVEAFPSATAVMIYGRIQDVLHTLENLIKNKISD